jgi:uncharacterized protein (DUF302 family)
MKYKILISAIAAIGITSCAQPSQETTEIATPEIVKRISIVEQVDGLNNKLQQSVGDLKLVASLDHHRMAKEVGVYTPPSIASIYSDASVNTDILSKSNPLVGLDLPFKFLCFSEADTTSARLATTSFDFIAKRHGLTEETLSLFQNRLAAVLKPFDNSSISKTNLDSVGEGYGIIKIQSDFDFAATVGNLKAIVESQSDTRWFGEIDYQKEAMANGVELSPNTLLLFGAPAPGGKAMMTTPKIGLDAFCQKLLVFQDDAGNVWVAFNDIVACSELYYGQSTKPQQMINQRLKMTFTKAVTDQKTE